MSTLDYSKFSVLGDEEADVMEQKALALDSAQAKDFLTKSRFRGESSDSDSDSELSPLFWTKPPSARRNPSTKALELEAMFEKMVYQGRDSKSLAEDFKERGNASFRHGHWKDAESLFGEALQWAYKAWTEEFDASELIAGVLANRAAIQLKIGNFRSAIKDAFASLKLAPYGASANKAKFRGAMACLALDRAKEAEERFLLRNDPPEDLVRRERLVKQAAKFSNDGGGEASKEIIPVSPEVAEKERMKEFKIQEERAKQLAMELKSLETLKENASKMKREQEEKEKRAYAESIRQHREDADWCATLVKHGVRVGPLTMDLQPYTGGREQKGGQGPRPDITNPQYWAWPCLFMYPEHSQSDFVQAFHESSSFYDVLSTMFPPNVPAPEWDAKTGAYTIDQLEVYYRERLVGAYDLTRALSTQINGLVDAEDENFCARKWYRVPLKTQFAKVLVNNKAYVVPGVPTFVVVSKASKAYRELFLKSCRERDGSVLEFAR